MEAFGMVDGDWNETRASLTVDKPVRVDLELPPAVHPGDRVTGRLRAATASHRARISLTRDGEALPFRAAGSEGQRKIMPWHRS